MNTLATPRVAAQAAPLTEQERAELAFQHAGQNPRCVVCRLLATVAERDAAIRRLHGGDA